MAAGIDRNPLALDGWLEFNRLKWKAQPLRIQYRSKAELPVINAVLYLNRRGQVVLPKLNPYLPLSFEATPTEKPGRLTEQWLQVGALMANDMRERGLRSAVHLPPEVADTRPWQWAGFRVGVAYTFYLDFPFDQQLMDRDLGRHIRKAQGAGYRAERTVDLASALTALEATEGRQCFDLGLAPGDLKLARSLLGDESLRLYICYAPDGAPASAAAVLHVPGGYAVGWVAGNCSAHLRAGAAQLTLKCAIEDLQAAGARGLDLAGANIPSVAAAKMQWGGSLRQCPTIEAYNLRTLGYWSLAWLRGRKGREGL